MPEKPAERPGTLGIRSRHLSWESASCAGFISTARMRFTEGWRASSTSAPPPEAIMTTEASRGSCSAIATQARIFTDLRECQRKPGGLECPRGSSLYE